MFSRAHILIQKEINEIEQSHENITISRIRDDNIFELIALIEGLPNTSWQNGIFQIYMKFNEEYNFEPPSVFFQTIPYHPNIEMSTGRPSVDFLDNK
jgi:ubiquitin-protein ligase